jgi:hypothetical protein
MSCKYQYRVFQIKKYSIRGTSITIPRKLLGIVTGKKFILCLLVLDSILQFYLQAFIIPVTKSYQHKEHSLMKFIIGLSSLALFSVSSIPLCLATNQSISPSTEQSLFPPLKLVLLF